MHNDNSIDKKVKLNTAVLFLIFNRPNTTQKVFEAIRQARPPRLYVAGDGPRNNRQGEENLVSKARQIATSVDWPCELKTLFQSENLGCKNAPSSGIDWFFENEDQGIILEDDCLPHQDFFIFCEILLNKYATDDRIWVITGDNFQNGQQRGDASYYFSRNNHVWGWASWRRAWVKRDMEIKFWPAWKESTEWKTWLPDKVERRYWAKIFDRAYKQEVDAWDYPWTASVWFNGGLTITPNVNLVSNIGFGPDATHTILEDSPQAKLATQKMMPIKHPINLLHDEAADNYAFNQVFGGHYQRFPYSVLRFPQRIVHALRRRLKSFLNSKNPI